MQSKYQKTHTAAALLEWWHEELHGPVLQLKQPQLLKII